MSILQELVELKNHKFMSTNGDTSTKGRVEQVNVHDVQSQHKHSHPKSWYFHTKPYIVEIVEDSLDNDK